MKKEELWVGVVGHFGGSGQGRGSLDCEHFIGGIIGEFILFFLSLFRFLFLYLTHIF